MTTRLNELKRQIDEIEVDGTQVTGIHLTAEMAKEIRWELNQMYGIDPGEDLVLLFGTEVLSHDAAEFKLDT